MWCEKVQEGWCTRNTSIDVEQTVVLHLRFCGASLAEDAAPSTIPFLRISPFSPG